MLERIETNRLVLRKIKRSDTPYVFSNWANDAEVTKYMTWLPHESVKITEIIMDKWMKDYENPLTQRYVITIKGNDEPIGMIDVVDYINDNPEIGYCLSRKHWNKGYMSEACKAFIDYLISLGYKEIHIRADIRNIGSNRVINKCGFKFTHQETGPCSSLKPEIITLNNYILKVN